MAGALVLFSGIAYGANLELPVPNVAIYPGDIIRSDLLVERSFSVPADENWAVHRSRDGLIGKTARRTLLPGKPIALNAVRDPHVVQQGKPVTLIFQSGGLTITGQAVPLQSGGVGDLLSLRNSESGAMVKGIVQADGSVRVAGP